MLHCRYFILGPPQKTGNVTFRITKRGTVNLTDVRRFRAWGGVIPLRYTDMGIHKLNPLPPIGGYPEDVVCTEVLEVHSYLDPEKIETYLAYLRKSNHPCTLDEW